MDFKQKLKGIVSVSAASLALLQSTASAKTKDVLPAGVNLIPEDKSVTSADKLILSPPPGEWDLSFAGHRSHSSHSSHSSHYSGTSSQSSHSSHSSHYSGTTYTAPSAPSQPATSYRVPAQQPVSLAPAPAVPKAELERRTIEWQKKQAEAGSSSAQYELALRYLIGNGVEKDVAKAISLLELAATAGHKQAAQKLDEVLQEQEKLAATNSATNVVGTNVIVELKAPADASESPEARLLYERGIKCLMGDGVEKDIATGRVLLELAAKEGSKPAAKLVKQLNEKPK